MCVCVFVPFFIGNSWRWWWWWYSSAHHRHHHHVQNPVSWQVSSDGSRMIGHMILQKSFDGEDILGLKVSGGKALSDGSRGAVVEKVKCGSIADQEGHINAGDFDICNSYHLLKRSFILLICETHPYFLFFPNRFFFTCLQPNYLTAFLEWTELRGSLMACMCQGFWLYTHI